jgi:hypothetical protein
MPITRSDSMPISMVFQVPSFCQTDLGLEDGLKDPAIFAKPRLPLGFRGMSIDHEDRDAK